MARADDGVFGGPSHRLPRDSCNDPPRVDDEPTGIQIEVVPVQRRELTPPAAGPRRRDHQQPRHENRSLVT
jgi:hypothetical protein